MLVLPDARRPIHEGIRASAFAHALIVDDILEIINDVLNTNPRHDFRPKPHGGV